MHHHEKEQCDPQLFMQWKFTSCRYNIENSNGFNTYSMSEGLSREDKDDLIRCAGAYTPPDHLPFHPTQAEIDALFPVVFASFPLRSGKWAVTRTVYIGKDYAGVRWGNFFSHGIISPNTNWPFYPIRLWNSPLFANGLTEKELREHSPTPLPLLTIDENDLFDFSTEIPRFLGDRSIREQSLFPLLEAVRNCQTSGKAVLLRDDSENLPLWLAAIQYTFPLRMAAGISFTTYMHTLSKSQRFHITGTSLEGHAIPLKAPSLKTSFHVFDFPEESIVTSPEPISGYMSMIRSDEAAYPGNELLELHPFIDQCECQLSGGSLDKCVLLYQYLYQPWKEPLALADFKSMFDFFSKQPLPLRLKLGTEILKKNARFTTEILRILFPHLLDVVVKSNAEPTITKLFFTLLVKHFARNIGPDNWKDSLERLGLLEEFLTQIPNDITKRFFDDVYRLVTTSTNPKPILFLYLSLLLCLHVKQETVYREYFKVFFDVFFDEPEFRHFIHEIIDCVIDKAVTPIVYGQMVKFHLANVPCKIISTDDDVSKPYSGNVRIGSKRIKSGKSDEEIKNSPYYFIGEYQYIEKLRDYELVNWRHGKDAKIQGVAFIRYVLGTFGTNQADWKAWVDDYKIVSRLLNIQSDNEAKTNALKKIKEQLIKENMPLENDDVLNYELLDCKTWERWISNHIALCIFLAVFAVLGVVFVILLICHFL